MEDANMLTSSNSTANSSANSTANSVSLASALSSASSSAISMPNWPNWPTLLEALQQLLPPIPSASLTPFPSETLLKLYTIVFDYCVGTGVNHNGNEKVVSAFMFGEELYKAVVAFISARFIEWSNMLKTLDDALNQMNCVATAEKPLIFIFTYLERHWIDRQINDNRVDVLPLKQLLWSQYDSLVLAGHLTALLPAIHAQLEASWSNRIPIEEVKQVALFVHYLRVISTPALVESDFAAMKRVPSAGLLFNAQATQVNRFADFVQWYREGITAFLKSHFPAPINESWIQRAQLFWNHEEGMMVCLRFDKNAQVAVRTCLKETLLLPNLEAFKEAFSSAILSWNVLEANAIYRLLANRKSLLVNLDAAAQDALARKGLAFVAEVDYSAAPSQTGQQFITLLGQFYNLSTELIQTALASRPEIFEARGRAFRVLLNEGKRAKFAAKSLALCADFVIQTFLQMNSESEQMLTILMALFRLLDEKDEFGEAFGALLARRLLTGGAARSETESQLLARLCATCGPAFTAHFERMHADIQARLIQDASISVCLLTGATWSIKGKRLLPGHPIIATAPVSWPQPAAIAAFEAAYLASPAHRSRRLNWIPTLSEVEFDLIVPGSEAKRIALRASCAQLTILQELSEGKTLSAVDELSHALLAPLVKAGLVQRDGRTLTADWDALPASIDVFSPLICELLSAQPHGTAPQMRSFSTTGTPSRKSTVSTACVQLSHADKLSLLQCQITRLLKQLRSLSLSDLYNRLSMLPVLLSRFSPEVEEVDAAVRGLAEKEFVQVVLVEADNESVLSGEETIKGAMNECSSDCIQVRYLA